MLFLSNTSRSLDNLSSSFRALAKAGESSPSLNIPLPTTIPSTDLTTEAAAPELPGSRGHVAVTDARQKVPGGLTMNTGTNLRSHGLGDLIQTAITYLEDSLEENGIFEHRKPSAEPDSPEFAVAGLSRLMHLATCARRDESTAHHLEVSGYAEVVAILIGTLQSGLQLPEPDASASPGKMPPGEKLQPRKEAQSAPVEYATAA